MLKQYKLKNYGFRLIAYIIILCVIGILLIGSAKVSVQKTQIVGLAGSLVIMVIFSLIDYSFLLKFWKIGFIFMNIILALVYSPIGVSRNGSSRWINIGFQFQPSELAKILFILFFAAYFMKHQEHLNTMKYLILSFGLAGIPLMLIALETDLSTTIIVTLIFITLLFLGGLSYKIVAGVLVAGVPISIVGVILLVNRLLPLQDYQYNRILSWIQPSKYVNSAYQQQNAITAIGSGQLWGKGLNNNSIVSLKNTNFISEPQTDFIFSVAGEELGFVGCVIIIILLLLIVIECIMIGRKAKDLSGRLICCGMAALIGFQSFVNISVNIGLMPNTGLPLPFVSYGLTSLMSIFIGIGIVLNVGLQPRKYGSGDFI